MTTHQPPLAQSTEHPPDLQCPLVTSWPCGEFRPLSPPLPVALSTSALGFEPDGSSLLQTHPQQVRKGLFPRSCPKQVRFCPPAGAPLWDIFKDSSEVALSSWESCPPALNGLQS